MGVGGQRHTPLTPGKKTLFPFYSRLSGPQGRSGRVRKTSIQPGFNPRTVQSVSSRYTDWAIPTHPRNSTRIRFKERNDYEYPSVMWNTYELSGDTQFPLNLLLLTNIH
jgi:hypothetical protein